MLPVLLRQQYHHGMGTSRHISHTGRELELMLKGDKPLAVFCEDANVPDSESVNPLTEFDQHVKRGVFSKAEEIYEGGSDPKTGRPIKSKYVLYAIKGEEWRIPAMLLLRKTRRGMTNLPDEGLSRMESALLGYSEAEIDAYFASPDSDIAILRRLIQEKQQRESGR